MKQKLYARLQNWADSLDGRVDPNDSGSPLWADQSAESRLAEAGRRHGETLLEWQRLVSEGLRTKYICEANGNYRSAALAAGIPEHLIRGYR